MNKEVDESDNKSKCLDFNTGKNEQLSYEEDTHRDYDSTVKSLINEGCPI